mgnify:CR=1 FL=1
MKVCIGILVLCTLVFAGYIMPSLEQKLSTLEPNEYIRVNIHLKERADLTLFPASATPEEKVAYLKEFASRTQGPLLAYLSNLGADVTNVHTWWIANVITLESRPGIIPGLAEHSDVDYVVDDITVTIDRETTTSDVLLAPAWNINLVDAELCWAAGFDGAGVVLGNIDTGVYTAHTGFGGRWRSVDGWFDGVGGQPGPYDDNGHGTHTMGTICGGTYSGTEYGVAKGAPFICAKGLDASGSGNSNTLRPCFQWYASLGSRSARAVGNSWGSDAQTVTEYWDDCQNLRNLGITPVFSIGNAGPGGGTAGTPGNYPHVIGVGATDNSDNIASYSSRGPAPNQLPWTNTIWWPRPDWNRIKPNLSAPGSNVTSFSRSGGTATMSGTSMASPHVTGSVGILLQKNPTLSFTDIYNLLLNNIDQPSQGAPYPNNNYGWGRLNVYRALQATQAVTKPVLVYDRNAVTGGNGNGRLDPGETANLITFIGNIGNATATNIQGRLRESNPYITLNDSIGSYRNMNPRDTASNGSDVFVVTADPGTPGGYIANFTLVLTCAETTYTRTFTLMVGLPSRYWIATHGIGNCTLSVSSVGHIGFTSTGHVEGKGFKYPKSGANHIFHSSLFACNSRTYVVDGYYEPQSRQDSDWVCLDTLIKVTSGLMAQEEFVGAFKDTRHPQAKGLRANLHTYAMSTDSTGYDDWVILCYDFINEGTSQIDNLHFAIIADVDFGGGTDDYGASDATRRMIHQRNSNTNWNPTVGIRVLFPKVATKMSVIDHAVYVYPAQGLHDTTASKFMDGTYSVATSNRNYDWSIVNSSGPYSLAVSARQRVVFAIIGGTTQATINENSDSAQAWWDRHVSIGEEEEPPVAMPFTIKVAPNPFNKGTKIFFYNGPKEKVKVDIYDVAGKLVRSIKVLPQKGSIDLSACGLSNGIYFIRVSTKQRALTEKIVLMN